MASKNARLEAAALVFVVFLLGLLLGGVGSHLWDEHTRCWRSKRLSSTPRRLATR